MAQHGGQQGMPGVCLVESLFLLATIALVACSAQLSSSEVSSSLAKLKVA